MSIAGQLAVVRDRIDRAARGCGRDPASVTLVAVSKTKGPDAIREAYAAGQRAFGENYAQELAAKATALADLTDLEWHFIGHLQGNKAKVAAKHAQFVHTVDSAALARELGRRVEREGRSAPLPVLIEVNAMGERQKAGATPSEIQEVMDAVRSERALALRGLMAIPPAGDLDAARKVFELVGSLRSLHGGIAVLPELSMGMSADLEVAVACGATMVRIGTAIFGERERRSA
ncbi:MAG TPA: YggS family pyridoxal phosphate-dependent enzyme [Polyangiaceae bacterium]